MVKTLQKGENLLLGDLNEIVIAVKSLKKPNDATEFDIDVSAFMLTDKNKVSSDADFIFYNQQNSSNNAVILKNNNFKVSLDNIPPDINKICFVITLHEGKQKAQYFGMLENMTIELFNFVDKQKMFSYCMDDANEETAIILGMLYRYQTEWKFRAMGQGYINGLEVLAKNFGVTIDEPVEQIQNPVPPSTNHEKNDTTVKENTENKSANSTKKPLSEHTANKNNPPKQQTNSEVNIHNTDMMTKEDHYVPIVNWLAQKNIQAKVNEAAMDTSGFFDEIAVELGDNYELLKRVFDTIKRRQQGKYDRAYIDLSRDNPQDIKTIQKFCQQLYDYAFVAKYFYINKDKKAVLHLQTATKIINFFNGEWLEWYAVMKIATLCHERKIKFSCTRNMMIYIPDDNNRYEIDVFFLINDQPLFIECKSGEYREFIDKYSRLRRKLFIAKPYFLMLISGVENEQLKGLTAMFDITFLNEKMLLDYIIEAFVKKKPIVTENNRDEPINIQNANIKPKTKPKEIKPPVNKSLELAPINKKRWNNKIQPITQTSRANVQSFKTEENHFFQKAFFICILILVASLSALIIKLIFKI